MDQGWQYKHSQFCTWLKRTRQRSKGNLLDEVLIKDCFGIFKREMFYSFKMNELQKFKRSRSSNQKANQKNQKQAERTNSDWISDGNPQLEFIKLF